MRQIAALVLVTWLGGGPVQGPKLSASDLAELAGRWIGTVTSNIGDMPIALNLESKDGRLAGVLETAHGNWEITEVKKSDGAWTIAVKAPDGLAGTLVGRVKDRKLTGDWNFKPRAVGTFDLSRPETSKR